MSRLTENRKYLKELMRPVLKVPAEAAANIAIILFGEMVESTAFDSGQAALNWHLQPYVGQASFESQKIMWGYGDVQPIAPAGYKWSGGANEAQVKEELIFQQMLMFETLVNSEFDGIVVYNPIAPGFPGFSPGSDEFYADNALSSAESSLGSAISKAFSEGYRATASRHQFVSVA